MNKEKGEGTTKYIYQKREVGPNVEIDIPDNAKAVKNAIFFQGGRFTCVVSWLEPME